MRRPTLVAVAAMLMTSAAYAQTSPPSSDPKAQPPARTQPDTRTDARTTTAKPATQEVKGPWHVKDFFRSNVYNTAGEKIGDINDILIDESGNVTAFVVGVGGFLGIGEKEVSVAPDQIKRMIHSDGKTYFTANMTKEQLQSAPAYTRPKT